VPGGLGQAEPRRVGPFQLLYGERHLGERLLEARNPPVPDRAEPVPGDDGLGLEDPERLGRRCMPDGCGERGAVRRPGLRVGTGAGDRPSSGRGRPVPFGLG
jgi:hypothetical protein